MIQTMCEIVAAAKLAEAAKMKRSTTEDYARYNEDLLSADKRLQADIAAARGVKPETNQIYPAPTPADVDAVLDERGKRYGKFKDHARITQALKSIMLDAVSASEHSFADDQIEALEMICHKLGRIANGDPNYADSWVDIAGYAKLVADRLEGVER